MCIQKWGLGLIGLGFIPVEVFLWECYLWRKKIWYFCNGINVHILLLIFYQFKLYCRIVFTTRRDFVASNGWSSVWKRLSIGYRDSCSFLSFINTSMALSKVSIEYILQGKCSITVIFDRTKTKSKKSVISKKKW